ncbi:MAG TPA: hypothetical protein VIO61_00260 [Anaerolineaceae bacterium]
MKNIKRTIPLLVFGVFFLFFLLITRNSSSSHKEWDPPYYPSVSSMDLPTRVKGCVPYPKMENVNSPTPTPNILNKVGVPAVYPPTVTLIPYRRIVDLDDTLTQSEKGSVIVFRCDGSWDIYWFNPSKGYKNDVYLQQGDVIWMVNPPSSLGGRKPPSPVGKEKTARKEETAIKTISPSITQVPYPAPGQKNSGITSYPVTK